MGQLGEVEIRVLLLKELARANRRFLSFRYINGKLVWSCVGCNDIMPEDLAFRGQWCDTCWGVLKLEAGYDG